MGADQIVYDSHSKSDAKSGQFMDTPIGKGGKVDDTAVVVAEIVEWTDAHREIWSQVRRNRQWSNVLSCGGMQCGGATRACTACEGDEDGATPKRKTHNATPGHRQGEDGGSEYGSESEDESSGCTIA